MEAYVIKSIVSGTVTLKSPFQGVAPIVLKNGSEHLFESPQMYLAYKSQVDRLVHSKMIVLQVIKQAESKSVSMSVPTSKVDAPEDAVGSDLTTTDSNAATATVELSDEDKEAIKSQLKADLKDIQDKYKAATEESEKEALKLQILDLKAKIKEL